MGYGENCHEKETKKIERVNVTLSSEWDLNITVGRVPDSHLDYYSKLYGKSQLILRAKRKKRTEKRK